MSKKSQIRTIAFFTYSIFFVLTRFTTANADILNCNHNSKVIDLNYGYNININNPTIKFKLDGIDMLIPYKYFLGRTSVDLNTCKNDRKKLDFVFWFPDLNPPEQDPYNFPDWRPHEDGRIGNAASFIVKVNNASRGLHLRQLRYITPQKVKPVEADLTKTGLSSVTPAGNSGVLKSSYIDEQQGSNATIDCYVAIAGEEACHFHLMLQSADFQVEGHIPRAGLPQWPRLKMSISVLLSRWESIGFGDK